LLATGCAPVSLLNATVPGGGVQVRCGLPYGDGPRRQLDIYRPAAAGRYPVVVFFYGGSWRNGRRQDYWFVAEPLARRGFVVVVPDYRLYPEVRFPDFLRDCAASVAWTQHHAEDLGGDGSGIRLMGHSAGAYNAAMVALDPALLAEAGGTHKNLACMAGLAGPYDFLPITDPDVIPVFAGSPPAATQPITYVDGHAPPLLLLAGADDRTVNPQNSRSLAQRIESDGGHASLRIYPGLGHIGIVIAFASLFRGKAPVLEDTAQFLKRPGGSAPGPR
jgi:acetyl esterase/lipase